MKKSNFDLLIHRYLTGQVSEHERAKIEAWLDQKKTSRQEELDLSEADKERIFQNVISPQKTAVDIVAMYPAPPRAKKFFTNPWIQAAACALVLCAAFITWVVQTSSPGAEKLILNDGTLVWLQEGSRFTYYEKKEDGTRHADFAGEALFEIAKIPTRPFTITCGNISVKVLGTSFSLKTGEGELELKVLTGRVNLSSTEDQAGVDVVPNEKVIYSVKGEVKRIAIPEEEVAALTVNTEYDMRFANTTMDKVSERIEKKFDVNINSENGELLKCRVTGDFTDNSLENTLSMLTNMLDMTYRIEGNKVVLSGSGCNGTQ